MERVLIKKVRFSKEALRGNFRDIFLQRKSVVFYTLTTYLILFFVGTSHVLSSLFLKHAPKSSDYEIIHALLDSKYI